MEFSAIEIAFAIAAIGLSFALSAAAGLGGSLLLVPSLALVLGTKSGVALAALLLGANNIVKLLFYRRTLPWQQAAIVVVMIATGAYLGAQTLVAAPERMVTVAVIVCLVVAFATERVSVPRLRRWRALALAFGAGATSGFSGTSGPLKGIAIRQLALDRMHFVGAASLASLFGDLSKALVFAEAKLLTGASLLIAGLAVPLIFGATYTGYRINRSLGERGYTGLFWLVMTGYSARLVMQN